VGIFNPITIGMLLVSLAMAYHIIRNGNSPMWLMALAVASFAGFYSFFATIAVWLAYLVFGVIPSLLRSHSARRLADNVVNATVRGAAIAAAQCGAGGVGGFKRALAEECIAWPLPTPSGV
jgi:hypothetical protein